MTDRLEFDNLIKEKNDRQLLEFVAEQTYNITEKCADYDNRLNELEESTPSKKKQLVASGVSGGVAGTVIAVIIGVIEYFRKAN